MNTTTPPDTKCSCGENGRYTGRVEGGGAAIFRCPKGHEWPVKRTT